MAGQAQGSIRHTVEIFCIDKVCQEVERCSLLSQMLHVGLDNYIHVCNYKT